MLQAQKPYHLVNALIAGIILLLIIYSGIFSATGVPHPIASQTSSPTLSTGLSRAFSEIVRFNFTQAKLFNPYAIPIFLFFLIQFFMRIIMSGLLLSSIINKKLLLFADILAAVLLFLWAFFKFITDQF